MKPFGVHAWYVFLKRIMIIELYKCRDYNSTTCHKWFISYIYNKVDRDFSSRQDLYKEVSQIISVLYKYVPWKQL